jgi:3-phenylpropionate/trans-cinnamate dioxygenase ferredoxin component
MRLTASAKDSASQVPPDGGKSAEYGGGPSGGRESWIRVASEADLVTSMSVSVDGHPVALFRTEEGIYALDDICSHEYSLLSEGEIWAGEVFCQKHGSRFNVRTGAVTGLPATQPVRTWSTKIEDGGIWIAWRPAKST